MRVSPTSTERVVTSGLVTDDRRAQSAVTVKTGDAVDADALSKGSPKGSFGDAGKSKDFEVVSETTQDATADPKHDIGVKANMYHEGHGTKLELERSHGVFELLLEQIRSSMDKGVKTEQPH